MQKLESLKRRAGEDHAAAAAKLLTALYLRRFRFTRPATATLCPEGGEPLGSGARGPPRTFGPPAGAPSGGGPCVEGPGPQTLEDPRNAEGAVALIVLRDHRGADANRKHARGTAHILRSATQRRRFDW